MKAFERLGWTVARTTGSHVILKKAGHRAVLSIPNHGGRDVSRMLLAKLVTAAEVGESDYLTAFKGKTPPTPPSPEKPSSEPATDSEPGPATAR